MRLHLGMLEMDIADVRRELAEAQASVERTVSLDSVRSGSPKASSPKASSSLKAALHNQQLEGQ